MGFHRQKNVIFGSPKWVFLQGDLIILAILIHVYTSFIHNRLSGFFSDMPPVTVMLLDLVLITDQLGGSDAQSKNPDQLERNLNFRTDIYDIHAVAEFNFVDYRIGNNKHYFTMFLFAGIGGYYFNPQSNMGKGYVNVNGLKTEGERSAYPKYQLNIPFGVGFKWNITSIFGLGVEWGPRKLFTDYLDDVSSTYPTGTGSLTGTMRGNPRSKDWYFFYGMTLTMRLPKGKGECHGMELSN